MKATLYRFICGAGIPVILLMAGCSQMQVRNFIDPRTDFLVYENTAVYPFENQSQDELGGDKMTEHFLTEVLREGKLHVMDPGLFRAMISEATKSGIAIDARKLTPDTLKEIGRIASVQGIFTGIVHEYKMVQIGSERYPVISMTTKFIDVETGTVVWQCNLTARGGPNMPLISVGESFVLGELSQKAARRAVQEFYGNADLR